MTDLTYDDLDRLQEQHSDGLVRETVMAIKSRLADLGSETDADRKAALSEELCDLDTVLEYELRESSRAGEDYINDGVFHVAR